MDCCCVGELESPDSIELGSGWCRICVDGVFLLRNLYPVLSATDAKTSKILLILVVVLHAGLAIAIKVLFFAYVFPSRFIILQVSAH